MLELIHFRRDHHYGMTTLYLRSEETEIQIRILNRADHRARRAFIRSFLALIRPVLKPFNRGTLTHSPSGKVSEKIIDRNRPLVFQSASPLTIPGAFGYQIQSKRLELGLTQAQLAHLLGIRRAHVSDLERGIHYPNANTRRKIRALLDIHLDERNEDHDS